MWHSPFKLYLYPENSKSSIEFSSILQTLKDLEFIDSNIAEKRYATGDYFVSLITFMGCSPNIELEPQEDKPYCYIEINAGEKEKFYSGINLKAAVCPRCKTQITHISNPADEKSHCPNCNSELQTSALNWRRTAFIAKSCIAIGNIYESEAIPNDQLLDALEKVSQSRWKYAYIREAKN